MRGRAKRGRLVMILALALTIAGPFRAQSPAGSVTARDADPAGGLSRREHIAALKTKSVEVLRQGRTDASLPYLRKLHELQPYDENVRYALARALLFPAGEDGAPGQQNRQRLLESAGHFEECVRLTRGVAAQGPALGLRLFYLGLARWWLGHADQALGQFELSYQADPNRIDALYNRFAIFEELDRPAEARWELQRYLNQAKTAQ